MKVAASPQSINRAMPEGGIQVTSHQSLVTPNPQSLIPSYSSLLSNFMVNPLGVPPFDYVRKRFGWFNRFRGFNGGGAAHKNMEAPRSIDGGDARK